MIKKLYAQNKVFLLVSICAVALYFFYNAFYFSQVFAFAFYKETEVTSVGSVPGVLSCITINSNSSFNLAPINKFYRKGGVTCRHRFTYQVWGATYQSERNSYMRGSFGYRSKIEKAYYFPLLPWLAIADNSFPEFSYTRNFLISTGVLSAFIFLVYALGFSRRLFKK